MNMPNKQEIVMLKYGGVVIAETPSDKDGMKALSKFISSRKYLSNIEDYLDYEKRIEKWNNVTPKLLAYYAPKHNPEESVLVTVEEFKYLKAFFVEYIDDMCNEKMKLEMLSRITGHTEVLDTIKVIEKLAVNPIKYLCNFINNDDLLHANTIMEYFKLLNQYKNNYEEKEDRLPEFAKVGIL